MRVLLFDIDGTLLMTNGGGKAALREAMAVEFGIDSVRADLNFAGRTDRALLGELLQQNGLPDQLPHRQRLIQRYVEILPEVLTRRGGRTMPGVTELLSRLAESSESCCCAMTGNLQQAARHKLAHFDLLRYVREIFGGDHDADRDDLARRTATALHHRYRGDERHQMIVVGDTPADIRCGHAIGAKVLAVGTGFHSRDELATEMPTYLVNDLSDVDQILDLLLSSWA